MSNINLSFPPNCERATFGEIARGAGGARDTQETVLGTLMRAVWQGILFETLEMPGLGSITPPVLARWARGAFGWPPLDANGAPVNFPQQSTDDEAELRKALAELGIADFSESAGRQLRSLSVGRSEFECQRDEILKMLAPSTPQLAPEERKKLGKKQARQDLWLQNAAREYPRLKDGTLPRSAKKQLRQQALSDSELFGSDNVFDKAWDRSSLRVDVTQ